MPAPIIPAPSTPSLRTLLAGCPAGREAPFFSALSWCHSVLIMFLLACDITQAAK